MSGFTLNGVAARIQEMDFEASAWKRYTALCALAHIRGTEKKTLVLKVFGPQGKESSNFKGAWTISQKFFAAGMSDATKATIAAMALDDAAKQALTSLEAHMTALGVQGKNAYAEVAHYTDLAALEAARLKAAEDAKAAAGEEAATETETDTAVSEETAPPVTDLAPARDMVAEAKALLDGMTMDELNAVAVHLTTLMTNAQANSVGPRIAKAA
jgi:hypothetical protein